MNIGAAQNSWFEPRKIFEFFKFLFLVFDWCLNAIIINNTLKIYYTIVIDRQQQTIDNEWVPMNYYRPSLFAVAKQQFVHLISRIQHNSFDNW